MAKGDPGARRLTLLSLALAFDFPRDRGVRWLTRRGDFGRVSAVANVDVAQRQSRGLISPWSVVRIHPSTPHDSRPRSFGAFCIFETPRARGSPVSPVAMMPYRPASSRPRCRRRSTLRRPRPARSCQSNRKRTAMSPDAITSGLSCRAAASTRDRVSGHDGVWTSMRQ